MAPKGGRRAAPPPHQDSSQLADILNPVKGIRDQQRRAGMIPVNHAKQNRDAVRQLSRDNRDRRARGEEPVPNTTIRTWSPRASPSKSDASGSPLSADPSRVVKVSARDYVLENAREAAVTKPRTRSQTKDDGRQWLTKEDFGLVPQYLQSLKLEMAAGKLAEQEAAEAVQMPAGMRVLGEEERQEMLDALSRSKRDVEAQLQALPFVLETPSQKLHKARIEERLAEIEEALRIFSQRRVLVRTDE